MAAPENGSQKDSLASLSISPRFIAPRAMPFSLP
jgi:hypothetical protein